MDLTRTIECIRDVAASFGLNREEATWYLFGSVLRTPASAQDVDLLVVTDSTDRALTMRARLYESSMPEPLHLITMSRAEEEPLRFITRERAIEVYPMDEGSSRVDTTRLGLS